MPRQKIRASQFSADIQQFLRLLHKFDVARIIHELVFTLKYKQVCHAREGGHPLATNAHKVLIFMDSRFRGNDFSMVLSE